MKNISRRVFIKGMAVAAVATAASTVLTGCKLPTGAEEPTVETPATNNVLTITNPDDSKKTLTITAGQLIAGVEPFASKDLIAINLKLDNKLGYNVPVVLKNSDAANDGNYANVSANNYYVVVEAYADDQTGKKMTIVSTGETGLVYNTTDKVQVGGNNVKDGYVYLDISNGKVKADSKITLKVTVNQMLENKANANFDDQAVYTLVDSAKFSYNV